jgi:hypothetical protein
MFIFVSIISFNVHLTMCKKVLMIHELVPLSNCCRGADALWWHFKDQMSRVLIQAAQLSYGCNKSCSELRTRVLGLDYAMVAFERNVVFT